MSGTSGNKAIQEGKKTHTFERSPEIFIFSSIVRRERQSTRVTSLVSASVQYSLQFFFKSVQQSTKFIPYWVPLTWSRPASACRKCSVLYERSWRPLLSGQDGRAGERRRVARWLEIQGRGRGDLAGAAQITVVKLPEQLFILHRQAFVHFGLLLEGFLQNHLLCGQLSAKVNLIRVVTITAHDERAEGLSAQSFAAMKTPFLPRKMHKH